MKNKILVKRTFFLSALNLDKNIISVVAILLITLFTTGNVYGQDGKNTISGVITDATGMPLIGATVIIDGKLGGVISDIDGRYVLEASKGDVIIVSFIGMETCRKTIENSSVINVQMETKANEMDAVTVVAFSKQKKESVIGSITTVKPSELKVPSSNLTNGIAGRMSGVIAYQRSGEPGRDNTEFFIRGVTTFGYKKDPLILVDNMELNASDLARLQPDDIASFSIMKDATATSLYGARGANGVILITTKTGSEGRAKVSVRIENAWNSPTQMIKLSDPITYMKLNNEAVTTRNPLGIQPYSQEKIALSTDPNRNKYVYPTVNWLDEMFKKSVSNQRANISVNGGGSVARYYLSATFNQDRGLMRNEKKNNFNSNINLGQYNLRANFNVNLTKTTEASIRFQSNVDDYRGPIDAGNILFDYALHASPVDYPKVFESDASHQNVAHPLYGNSEGAKYINPYAIMSSGYKDSNRSLILSQADIRQNFDFITKGLQARALYSTTQYSYFETPRSYNPFFYKVDFYDKDTDKYYISSLNADTGTEYLDYNGGAKDVSTKTYIEAALEYNRVFGLHGVSGLLVYNRTEELIGNPATLIESFPYRNQGFSGRFTYGFDSRYMIELNFGYNGSERFAKDYRYGFFPAVGVAWNISNEKFWSGLTSEISKFKLKTTYGLVGNDAIGSPGDRFFYLSDLNMSNKELLVYFGSNFGNYKPGISINRYPNNRITWEIARKANYGFELALFDNKLEIQADYFTENRTNILMTRSSIPSSAGLEASIRANTGEASSQGVDLSLDYKHSINKDLWFTAKGNFTYATSEFIKADEPDYAKAGLPWRSRIGRNLSQQWGYIAERLFIDEADVANSPSQTFGSYMPGDIKYKDINNDGKIDDSDLVPIGHPTTPEIVYGFGLSMGYKDFDLSCFFQGLARESFFIDAEQLAPFNNPPVTAGGVSKDYVRKTALLEAFANSHWSESNRNIYATWPRLSTDNYASNNNYQRSTWWMRNGSFLRLKSIEFGYSFPKSLLNKVKAESIRVYVSGTNLLTFSQFKDWDPEMGGLGIGYPIQRVVNCGLQVSF